MKVRYSEIKIQEYKRKIYSNPAFVDWSSDEFCIAMHQVYHESRMRIAKEFNAEWVKGYAEDWSNGQYKYPNPSIVRFFKDHVKSSRDIGEMMSLFFNTHEEAVKIFHSWPANNLEDLVKTDETIRANYLDHEIYFYVLRYFSGRCKEFSDEEFKNGYQYFIGNISHCDNLFRKYKSMNDDMDAYHGESFEEQGIFIVIAIVSIFVLLHYILA